MYLKQMGQVPLLTREQEVEISKRIEEAEIMVQQLINRFGFIAQSASRPGAKLTEGRERFDRVILDKKIESRERYMKLLPRLCKQVEKLERNNQASSTLRCAKHLAHGSEEADESIPEIRSMPCNGFIRNSISNKRSRRNSSIWPIEHFALLTAV